MNNRRFNRIKPNSPILAKAHIYKYKNKKIISPSTILKVENYSLSGLQFSSKLNFPISNELILSLEFSLFGLKNEIQGTNVWQRKKQKGYIYGFEIRSTNLSYYQTVTLLTSKSEL
jgi:hypothetical protein